MNETNHPALVTCTLIQDLLGVTDGGIYEAVVSLKQRLDAVVAECADLKSSREVLAKNALETCNDVFTAGFRNVHLQRGLMESTGNRNLYPNPIKALVDEAVRDIETPATSTALAEQQAIGVDRLIAKKLKQLETMHPDTHAFGATAMSIRAQINEMQAFAAALRKGESQ